MKTIKTKLGIATLKNKAWLINTNGMSEPWYVTDEPFYGETNSEAKGLAFKMLRGDNISIKDKYGDWVDLTYLNLKMFRSKHHDQYGLNGDILSLSEIEKKEAYMARKEELEKLILDNPEAFVYIRKGGYYYGQRYSGYTEYMINAGIYPIKDGVREVLGCDIRDNMGVVLVDKETHNQRIKAKMTELEGLIIT